MSRKVKWIVWLCVLIFVAFMGNIWYKDYQNMHKTIETPKVDADVRG